jgi:hypothetical protein
MPEPRIIIFVKAPRPGFVKTRLAVSVGNKAACDAYRHLTETVLNKLSTLKHLEIRFTPDNAKDEIKQWLRNSWVAKPQGEGDLGQRMHRAFKEAGGPAIIVGSDCPYLELTDLQAANEALQSRPAVIGPATDGGYWLIGLVAPCPTLFNGINWSTNKVLEGTLVRLKKAGLPVHLLRELADVDTIEDWASFNK